MNIRGLTTEDAACGTMACQKFRVLVADGHDIVRRGIRDLFREQINWEICGEADNGIDAIDLIDRLRPDIAVLEYSLPHATGLDIARHIARNGLKCQVLFYTMDDLDDLIHDALRAGARGFVPKSHGELELMAALRSLAQQRPYFSGRSALSSSSTTDQSPLTARERQVIQAIARGDSNKGIAAQLNLSVKTVESHRASAMRKTGSHSGASLTRYAIRNRMVEP